MKIYALALDLKDDEQLIKEYEQFHQAIWPEIKESIQTAGITDMRIYRLGNRLFMLMEVTDEFSFEKKAAADAANPIVQKWEELMWKYQQPLPQAGDGEKWVIMSEIFRLN